MAAATFYMPSPPNEIDDIMHEFWKEGNARHLIHVKRMSSKGNPYVRGLLVSTTDAIPLPPEFELSHVPDDRIDPVYERFEAELDVENNGAECL